MSELAKKSFMPKSLLKNLINKIRGSNNAALSSEIERLILLQGTLHAKLNNQKNEIKSLAGVEWRVFSQWGEDGIIDWLVERLPDIPDTFIEFGVGNYRESNTRMLLQLRNWRGLVLDGSQENIDSIKNQNIFWRHTLIAKRAFIDRDNINELIVHSGFNGDIGLLSIDIDGNDYWVWEAISVVSPVVVVCEYNAVFGDLYKLTVPYGKDFQRTMAHFSNLYFGASLPALIDLAQHKGYVFVGTNSNGCNAFFIRNDRAHGLLKSISEIRSFPSSIRESRDTLGQLTFLHGDERIRMIRHLPVVDLETNTTKLLADFGDLYSAKWRGAN